jgi:hypothetical protein
MFMYEQGRIKPSGAPCQSKTEGPLLTFPAYLSYLPFFLSFSALTVVRRMGGVVDVDDVKHSLENHIPSTTFTLAGVRGYNPRRKFINSTCLYMHFSEF